MCGNAMAPTTPDAGVLGRLAARQLEADGMAADKAGRVAASLVDADLARHSTHGLENSRGVPVPEAAIAAIKVHADRHGHTRPAGA